MAKSARLAPLLVLLGVSLLVLFAAAESTANGDVHFTGSSSSSSSSSSSPPATVTRNPPSRRFRKTKAKVDAPPLTAPSAPAQQQQKDQQQNVPSSLPDDKDKMTVVWWTLNSFQAYKPRLEHCQHVPECGSDVFVTNDVSQLNNSAAVMFNAFDMIMQSKPDPPKIPGQKWVVFSMEPASYYGAVLNNATALKKFDMSMTYRMDSDVPVPYFPDHLSDIYAKRRQVPPPKFPNHAKSKIFFMSSNCKPRSERFKFVKKLMQHIHIDSYGLCEHNIDFPEDYKELSKAGDADKEKSVYPVGRLYEFLAAYGYKFILAFENSNCKDYMSEKYWRALESGLVPIYLGAPNAKEYFPAPNAMYDVWNEWKNRPAALAMKIKRLLANDRAYQAELSWKDQKDNPPAKLKQVFAEMEPSRWCRLCAKLRQWRVGKWQPPHPPQPDNTCPKDQYATARDARIAAGVKEKDA